MAANLFWRLDIPNLQDLLPWNQAALFHIFRETGQFGNTLLKFLRRDKCTPTVFPVQIPLAHQQVNCLPDGRPTHGIYAFQLTLGGNGLVRFQPACRNLLTQDIRQLVISRQKSIGVDYLSHLNLPHFPKF
jgi:hypothetical protein